MSMKALLVNGTCGAGKTTVGASVAQVLAEKDEAVAFIDMDALGVSWPRLPDDPFNTRMAARNLASLATDFSDAGTASIVLAGVIRDHAGLTLYETALGSRLTVVRLVAPPDVIDDRLRHRHGSNDPEGLAWHRRYAPELDAILDLSQLPMVSVENVGTPRDVARSVLVAAGWATASS